MGSQGGEDYFSLLLSYDGWGNDGALRAFLAKSGQTDLEPVSDAAGGELVGNLDPLPRGGHSEIVRSAEPLRSEGSEGQPSSAEVG